MVRPLPTNIPVSFPYGARYRNGTIHKGVDFSRGREGEAVAAMAAGVVTHAGYGGWGPAYGQHVIIRSLFRGSTKWHLYGHLKTEAVRVGQSVKAGQQIGTSGGGAGKKYSGNSTGPHLHAQVGYQNRYDRHEDPWPMINAQVPTKPKPMVKYTDGLFWNLAASDQVHGKATWDARVPGIVEALKHYDRTILQLVEAETHGKQGVAFEKALNSAGYKVAVGDNQRMIAVKKTCRVGAIKVVTLRERGPENDDKQIVMAEVTAAGAKPLVIECGHFEFRDGAVYDNVRAAQAKETRTQVLAFAKELGHPVTRIVAANDENSRSGTNGAWGTTFTDLRARKNVVYGNASYSSLSGWDGVAHKSTSAYVPDKVRVHKDRPVIGGSTSLTFVKDRLSDHLAIPYTLGKIN